LLFARIPGHAENAAENPRDIAVEDRHWLIERDAANGAGRVASDARQRQNIFESFREMAAVPGDNHSRCRLQVAGARVVAETLPELQHFFGASACERLDRR